MIGHFEEKNENKYLVLDDVDENKEVSKKYKEVWEGVKKKLKRLMMAKKFGEKIEYRKDYMKNRFKSNDDLPLNKPIKLRLLTIIIKSVFSENGKFYPQLFQMMLCMNYKDDAIQ